MEPNRTRTHITIASVIAAAIGVAGCQQLKLRLLNPHGPSERAGYDGPACHREGSTDEKTAAIGLIACGQTYRYASQASDVPIAVAKRHREFDDRHPDAVLAALNVVECSEACATFPIALAVSAYEAEVLDDRALALELDDLHIEAGAKTEFLRRVAAAKPVVVDLAARLDPRRRHMYVEALHTVVAARQAYFKRHAALYARLDALAPRSAAARASGKLAPEVVTELAALRAEYLARCAADVCRFDPFVVEVTRELVLDYGAAGDPLMTRAENALLVEPSAGRHLFSVETGIAIYEAMVEERRAAEQYKQAKAAGIDAKTLEARFGTTPPVMVDPETDFIGADQLPDLAAALLSDQRSFSTISGVVRGVASSTKRTARGEPLVQVTFRDNVTTGDVTSCAPTGRISGVTYDADNHARVEYEESCSVVGEHTEVEKVAPIFVPRADGTALRSGELVVAIAAPDSREGAVLRAMTKSGKAGATTVVQVRESRLAVAKH